jgi:hypothetical protein
MCMTEVTISAMPQNIWKERVRGISDSAYDSDFRAIGLQMTFRKMSILDTLPKMAMITSIFPSSAFSSFCYLSGVSDPLMFLSQNCAYNDAWGTTVRLCNHKARHQWLSGQGVTMMNSCKQCSSLSKATDVQLFYLLCSAADSLKLDTVSYSKATCL